ncbi:MAG: hypothetical protein OXK20_01520 [Deltaproteobacteria bacterium]|nr:hypothetical protein [Deltaproteobacteria bacterium]
MTTDFFALPERQPRLAVMGVILALGARVLDMPLAAEKGYAALPGSWSGKVA